MKNIYLSLLFTLLLTYSFGQKCYIGFTKEEIKVKISNDSSLSILKDTTNRISVMNNELDFGASYYIDGNGKCYSYLLFYKYYVMNDIIKTLNTNFVKYDEKHWLNFTKMGIYQLELQREENFFVIVWTFKGK